MSIPMHVEQSAPAHDPQVRSTGRVRRIVMVSQTFVPDPASVGQHMTDVAKELARRGYDVRVYASARGYEDASVKYLSREALDAGGGAVVDVRRLPLASFGKRNLLLRVFGTASFHLQAMWRMMLTPRVEGVFFSTSPPLIGVTAGIARLLRGVPIVYWAMDLNPDQLIVMGKLKATSLTARALEAVNRFILRRSTLIVALDRFMCERLQRRGQFGDKILVVPPWPHDENIEDEVPVAKPDENPFRIQHGLVGKRVIMYSGNHSPANPLTTLLKAAVEYKDDDRVRFVFVGGGTGKKEVNACISAHGLKNMLSLPYQPLADLKYSLAAADVHVVSMGQEMAGIIHPCKIYGAMSAGRAVLYLGPSPSHISDILESEGCGWRIAHGDVAGMKRAIDAILAMPASDLQALGTTAQRAAHGKYSQAILLKRITDATEIAFAGAGVHRIESTTIR